MPRSIGRLADFTCLNCSTTWSAVYWLSEDATWTDEANRSSQSACRNPDCTQPHVSVTVRRPLGAPPVGVRASQRYAVYEYPDGTLRYPDSNDPMNPTAQSAIREGAIRREVDSIYALRGLQKRESERRLRDWIDEHGEPQSAEDARKWANSLEKVVRASVLDFDAASRMNGEDLIAEYNRGVRDRSERLAEAMRNGKFRLGSNKQYDRARAESERRGNRVGYTPIVKR